MIGQTVPHYRILEKIGGGGIRMLSDLYVVDDLK
jgi:hypothetical protein